ncbi:phage portal protein [Pimelobacter simplex]|uniref:Phage portal protein n=1 Tax=Nocardioides simplex TaxID=2045 RepID=A0A7J5DQP6_NOCSI|nr:phage portal protein [Pimelobacter simplex]
MIFGRAFMSVGTNEDDPDLPLVRVESPRQMAAIIDTRKERIEAAARFYRKDGDRGSQARATLFKPNETIQVERGPEGKWIEVDRDDHKLGAVPIVMHLNRRLSGSWSGESQMTDIIPVVDSAARSLTNLPVRPGGPRRTAHVDRRCAEGRLRRRARQADPTVRGLLRRDPHDRERRRQGRSAHGRRPEELRDVDERVPHGGVSQHRVPGAVLRAQHHQPAGRGRDPSRRGQADPVGGGTERAGRHVAGLGRRAGDAVRHRRVGEGQPCPGRVVRPGHPDRGAAHGRRHQGRRQRHPVPRRCLGRARLVRAPQGEGARLLLAPGSRAGRSVGGPDRRRAAEGRRCHRSCRGRVATTALSSGSPSAAYEQSARLSGAPRHHGRPRPPQLPHSPPTSWPRRWRLRGPWPAKPAAMR